jgi:hypothetical protein
MSIPMSWAIALAVAGTMGGVLLVGFAAHGGVIAAPERALVHLAYLLGGGVAGFLAIAFYPAWPLLAAVVGMLVVQAVRSQRVLDIGLLMAGFGGAWTLLLGLAILNDLTDPAVISTQDDIGVFVVAAVVLLIGVATAVIASVAPIHRPIERR